MRRVDAPLRAGAEHALEGAALPESNTDTVRFEAVSHWFIASHTPKMVLADINLSVPENQFVAIVGASGCGKTTLLNMVAGLIEPEAGRMSIEIAGRTVRSPSPDIGYMWARDTLLPWRSLHRNLEFGLEIRGVSRAERRDRVAWALDLVGLTTHAGQYPRELSQGMRQRGNLARLLVLDPQLFLFDEPFSALDAQTKIKLQREFNAIWQARPRTVLYVTHDLGEAALLADRVIIMSGGQIRHDIPIPFGRPRNIDELRFDPASATLTQELWHILETLEPGRL